MNVNKIILGKHYRLKSSPDYGFVRPIEILNPRQKENNNNHIVIKCEHITHRNARTGFVRYFKLSQISEDKD